MGGRDQPFARPDRRVFTLGLAAGALSVPSLALADPAPVAAAAPEPVPDAVLAASVDLNDRMTVPVTVNGRGPFPFVIDTGSNRTVVSDALAYQLGLPSAG